MNSPQSPSGSDASGVARPSVIQLAIKEKSALYAAYMPIFADGGLFIPTTREFRLGESVYVLVSLPDDPQRYPVAGTVAWVTPAKSTSNRTQGIGVQFPKNEKAVLLKVKIEQILGAHLASERATQTI